jgi:uncharacterized protein (DUF4415 family)
MEYETGLSYQYYFIHQLCRGRLKSRRGVRVGTLDSRMTGESGVSKHTDDQETSADDGTSKKTNVTLALDARVIRELRKEAKESQQSLNVKINAILRKHVNYYRMVELNGEQ